MREVLDDEASAMSVEEELMNNVVKINGVWQFRSTQKISKRQKEAQVARIEEEQTAGPAPAARQGDGIFCFFTSAARRALSRVAQL